MIRFDIDFKDTFSRPKKDVVMSSIFASFPKPAYLNNFSIISVNADSQTSFSIDDRTNLSSHGFLREFQFLCGTTRIAFKYGGGSLFSIWYTLVAAFILALITEHTHFLNHFELFCYDLLFIFCQQRWTIFADY